MTATDQTINVFDMFVKAKEALEQLPAAQAQVNDLSGQLEVSRHYNAKSDDTIRQHQDTIAELNIKLSALEARLESESFRVLEANDRLETVLKALGSAARVADEIKVEMNPPELKADEPTEPEHAIEGVSVSTDPTIANVGSYLDNVSTPTVGATGEGTVQASHTFGNESVYSAPSEGQSAPHPTEAGSSTASAPSASVSLTDPSPIVSSPTAEAPAGVPLPKPYWLKPTPMTWTQWEALGNDIPTWAKDTEGHTVNHT